MINIKTDGRLTKIKQGRKVIFEVMQSRNGKKFHSFKSGLGLVLDSLSLEDCIEESFNRIGIINEDFKNRLISI